MMGNDIEQPKEKTKLVSFHTEIIDQNGSSRFKITATFSPFMLEVIEGFKLPTDPERMQRCNYNNIEGIRPLVRGYALNDLCEGGQYLFTNEVKQDQGFTLLVENARKIEKVINDVKYNTERLLKLYCVLFDCEINAIGLKRKMVKV